MNENKLSQVSTATCKIQDFEYSVVLQGVVTIDESNTNTIKANSRDAF
jgi:hypothetical protein